MYICLFSCALSILIPRPYFGATANYLPLAPVGLVLGAVATPQAVNLTATGSYMGGGSIGIVQATPILYASAPQSAIWIMCKCTGTKLQMVQVVISVSGGVGYVNATAAGSVIMSCSSTMLTRAAVFNAWNVRSVFNVATCDTCDGFGVRSLAYTIAGISPFRYLPSACSKFDIEI